MFGDYEFDVAQHPSVTVGFSDFGVLAPSILAFSQIRRYQALTVRLSKTAAQKRPDDLGTIIIQTEGLDIRL